MTSDGGGVVESRQERGSPVPGTQSVATFVPNLAIVRGKIVASFLLFMQFRSVDRTASICVNRTRS